FYRSDSLQLPAGRQYQLRITTASNATYESAPAPLKVTPPIDKLAWQLRDGRISILLDTHDASAQSRYYRWKLVETWQFHTLAESRLEYFPNPAPGRSNFGQRTTPIYTCWRTEQPTTINQGTSAGLSQDALTNTVITSFSDRAERVEARYSVLVSQLAETAEEFAYLELLRKNTEAVGTVNDPLPTQLTGNVHRVDNASEPVLGFVGAHTVQQQRLFIDSTQLPYLDFYQYDTPYKDCQVSTQYFCDDKGVCDADGVLKLFTSPTNIPLEYIGDPVYGLGITSATADCADCRTRGTTTKPSFW
ncbi:MAG: DUF4249 domain-containing protein, partial [Hymenobacter sp.]